MRASSAQRVSYTPERVIEFLLNCKLVVSSWLHGLIVSEAFGVPARWLSVGGSAHSEGAFKYQVRGAIAVSDAFTSVLILLDYRITIRV